MRRFRRHLVVGIVWAVWTAVCFGMLWYLGAQTELNPTRWLLPSIIGAGIGGAAGLLASAAYSGHGVMVMGLPFGVLAAVVSSLFVSP